MMLGCLLGGMCMVVEQSMLGCVEGGMPPNMLLLLG